MPCKPCIAEILQVLSLGPPTVIRHADQREAGSGTRGSPANYISPRTRTINVTFGQQRLQTYFAKGHFSWARRRDSKIASTSAWKSFSASCHNNPKLTYKSHRQPLDVCDSRGYARGMSFTAYVYQLCKRGDLKGTNPDSTTKVQQPKRLFGCRIRPWPLTTVFLTEPSWFNMVS